jgi:hypothetical protein
MSQVEAPEQTCPKCKHSMVGSNKKGLCNVWACCCACFLPADSEQGVRADTLSQPNQKCVKCGHDKKRFDRITDTCAALTYKDGDALVLCRCRCEFPNQQAAEAAAREIAEEFNLASDRWATERTDETAEDRIAAIITKRLSRGSEI